MRTSPPPPARTTLRRWRGALIPLGLASSLAGCATVKPQQRATLADPTMVFDDDAHVQAQREHALENREGAYGGSGVAGGGCGCN